MTAKVVRPSGLQKRLERQEFIDMLARTYKPTVYVMRMGILGRSYRYLLEWEGNSYITETRNPFKFTDYVQVENVKKIRI